MTEQDAIFVIQALPQKIWDQMGSEDYEAIDMGIEALEKQMNNGWILCSERLPEESTHYLVTTKIMLCSRTQYLRDICLFGTDNKWISRYTVTAWQPLPEPYKAGVDNE